jgi:hypothetical protein
MIGFLLFNLASSQNVCNTEAKAVCTTNWHTCTAAASSKDLASQCACANTYYNCAETVACVITAQDIGIDCSNYYYISYGEKCVRSVCEMRPLLVPYNAPVCSTLQCADCANSLTCSWCGLPSNGSCISAYECPNNLAPITDSVYCPIDYDEYGGYSTTITSKTLPHTAGTVNARLLTFAESRLRTAMTKQAASTKPPATLPPTPKSVAIATAKGSPCSRAFLSAGLVLMAVLLRL